nr:hypothetical protein [uncultured Acetatifactor sp.]
MMRYKKSVAKMPEPVLLSQCPEIKLDLRGLMECAKEKGVRVIKLTEKEKAAFIRE